MMKDRFLPYEEAKAFVHKLKLKGQIEWYAYCESGERPRNIPSNPHKFYKNTGWIEWRHWVGKEKFLSYEEAKAFVHTLKLESFNEWKNYRKNGECPSNIPGNPYDFYLNKGWINWYDWLGTQRITFLPYEEAKAFVHSLNLMSSQEWWAYCKKGNRPRNIPANPSQIYKNEGWIKWYDWLGKDQFLPFDEAKEFVHSLKLKGLKEWYVYYKSGERPRNIPSNPHKFYKNKGWRSYYDWLGKSEKTFLSYEEAKAFVHSLNLKNKRKWYVYCKSEKSPSNIPCNPHSFYKKEGWLNWYDWLGTQKKAKRKYHD